MNHRIFRLQQNQFLEVQESLRGISNQVAAFSTEKICIKELIVKFDYFGKVQYGLLEHGKACMASPLMEQVRGIRLLLATSRPLDINDRVNVAKSIIKAV